MSTSIKNFIPLFNKVLDFYGKKDGKNSAQGITYAAIFGRVWGYSQMSKKVCNASHGKIANDLHISRMAVRSACEKMVEDGFLRRVSSIHGMTNEYTANLDVLIEINIDVEEPDTCKQRLQPDEPVNNVNRGCKQRLQGGVNNVNTNIYNNIKEDITIAPNPGASETPISQEKKEKDKSDKAKPGQSLEKKGLDLAEGSQKPLDFLPPSTKHLAQAFVEAAGENHLPIKAEQSLWRKVTNEWAARKYTPDVIKQTVAKMRKDNLTIKGPQSITGIAKDLLAVNHVSEVRVWHAGDPLD